MKNGKLLVLVKENKNIDIQRIVGVRHDIYGFLTFFTSEPTVFTFNDNVGLFF